MLVSVGLALGLGVSLACNVVLGVMIRRQAVRIDTLEALVISQVSEGVRDGNDG